MKYAATISTNEKKTQFNNPKISGMSRGPRNKPEKVRKMKAPAARNGAYSQLIYRVRNRGMKYRIHTVKLSGVIMSI